MNIYHTDLDKRWASFSIYEQMANIGAEVGRSINWKNKKNEQMSKNAFYRALELIDFTLADPKNKGRLSEIMRMRELLVDYILYNNIYRSDDKSWEKYFYFFNLAARNLPSSS